MAQILRPLQLVQLESNKKANGYAQALNRKYDNMGLGDSICVGLTIVILGLLVGLFSCVLLGAANIVAISRFYCAMAGFGSFIFSGAVFVSLFEISRRRGVKCFLQDSEAKYLYQLQQTVRTYNKQVEAFNKRLVLCKEDENEAELRKLRDFWDAMDKERKSLQKRIGFVGLREDLPKIDMGTVRREMALLSEAERSSGIFPPRSAPPALKEYKKALAELDAEIPFLAENTKQ